MISSLEQEFGNLDTGELRTLALALNPTKFAQQFIEPDPWQKEILSSKEKRIILNCSRQSGKSTITAILALHHALNNPGVLVLVLSPTIRQSGELFKKIMWYYKDIGHPMASIIETALTIQLANRSRIVALPGNEQTVRGYSGVSLLIVDEAARVVNSLYDAVRPMLAVSHGKLVLLSTPKGRSGFFYEEWTKSEERWFKVCVTAEECPRIDKEFLDTERTKGDRYFMQEYMCEFRENEEGVFSIEEIENAFSKEVKPLFDPVTGELDVPVPDKPIARGMIDSLGWGI